MVRSLYEKVKLWIAKEKLVVGCGTRVPKGWTGSDLFPDYEHFVLDTTKSEDWERYFLPGSLSHILSEHLFEHLDDTRLHITLKLCKKYLCKGGLLRIAVPDGFRPDKIYQQQTAPPADDHKQHFTVESLNNCLKHYGFRVANLEYFDRHGEFHHKDWDVSDGFVMRSYKYDRQETFRMNDHYYTSLIVDAFKD